MKTQVTMKTIAEQLDLSISTVSRALSDQWDINAETKEKVLATAIRLNYRPNIIAIKLKQCHQKSAQSTKRPKTTLKELACQLGLSTSTTSKALANKKDISPDTRKLVQTLAKKLHYYPNPLAYALRQYGKYVSV